MGVALLTGRQRVWLCGLITNILNQFMLEGTFGGHLGVGVRVGVYWGVPGLFPGRVQPSTFARHGDLQSGHGTASSFPFTMASSCSIPPLTQI